MTKPFLVDGQAYRLADVSATGDRLVIERSDQAVTLAVGFEMPNFTAVGLDGSVIELAALRGKPVVLNWWQTFCSPCVKEIPELNDLVEKYADRGVEFLAIADNEAAELETFLKNKTFDYDIALGNEEAVRIFGQGYPRHVIVDGEDKVVYDVHGYSSGSVDKLDAIIASLLLEL